MKFLERYCRTIDLCIINHVGKWIDGGTKFYVYDINTFRNIIKPYSLNTFKRQLHYYNFRIIHCIMNKNKTMTFINPNIIESNYKTRIIFCRGSRGLLLKEVPKEVPKETTVFDSLRCDSVESLDSLIATSF